MENLAAQWIPAKAGMTVGRGETSLILSMSKDYFLEHDFCQSVVRQAHGRIGTIDAYFPKLTGLDGRAGTNSNGFQIRYAW